MAPRTDLTRLAALTEAVWHAESAKLRRLATEEQRIAARLAGLDRDKATSLAQLAHQGVRQDPAQLISTARWMRWAEAERRRLNVELARARAALEAERVQSRKAFGKNAAVDALQQANLADEKRDRARAQKKSHALQALSDASHSFSASRR